MESVPAHVRASVVQAARTYIEEQGADFGRLLEEVGLSRTSAR